MRELEVIARLVGQPGHREELCPPSGRPVGAMPPRHEARPARSAEQSTARRGRGGVPGT